MNENYTRQLLLMFQQKRRIQRSVQPKTELRINQGPCLLAQAQYAPCLNATRAIRLCAASKFLLCQSGNWIKKSETLSSKKEF